MKWSLPFISPFVLSLVSLAHRAPHAEASHLVLQMRLPGVKWLCRHLSSEGLVQSLCTWHCDSRWRPGGHVQRCWPSTMIWSHGLSLSCENPPIPQLTGITHSSPRGALRRKPVLYSAFMDTSRTWQRGFPGGSAVKNLPASAGDSHWSLGQADPLELKLATRSTILVWEIPLTEESCGLQSMGLQRVRSDWAHTHTPGRMNPLGFGLWLGRAGNKIGRSQTIFGFPGGSDGKESACNGGDPGSIPGSRRFPGEGNGLPLQHSSLEKSMEFWWAIKFVKSQTVRHNWATYTCSHFLAMKAAAIWEDMRSFASNNGSHLAAGWNYLWGFKKCWRLLPLPRDSDLTEMRSSALGFQRVFPVAKFTTPWPLGVCVSVYKV